MFSSFCSTRIFGSLGFILMFCTLQTGCASTDEKMVPDLPHGPTFPVAASVRVTGASDFNVVSNATYKTALESTLKKAGPFSEVSTNGGGEYLLAVDLVTAEPLFGIDMTVKVDSSWRLIRRANNTVVWDHHASSSCTKTFGDSVIGAQREILAAEGAVRDNITQGVTSLQQLNWPPDQPVGNQK